MKVFKICTIVAIVVLSNYISANDIKFNIEKDCSTIKGLGKKFETISMNDNATLIALADENFLYIRSFPSLIEITKIPGLGRIRPIEFSNDGNYLAVGSFTGNVNIIDLKAKKIIHMINNIPKWVESLQFSPDSKFLMIGAYGNKLSILNLKDMKIVKEINFKGSINTLRFVNKGKSLLVGLGETEESIILIETENWGIKNKFGFVDDGVYSMIVNKNEDLVMTGTRNSPHRIWEIKTGKLISEIDIRGIVNEVYFLKNHKNSVLMTNFLDDNEKIYKWDFIKNELEIYMDNLPFYPNLFHAVNNKVYLIGNTSDTGFME